MQVEVYLKNFDHPSKITLTDVTKKDMDTWTSVRLVDFPYANGRLIIPFSSVSYFMVTE